MKVFEYNGNLCFWWPRVSYWNSFEVRVRDAGGSPVNRVTNISNSTEPSSSKKITVNMYASAVYGRNYGSDILYATAYHSSTDTSRYVNPASQSNMGKILFMNTVNQGTPVGEALVGRNYAYNTLELKGYGAEMMIGSQSQDLHINYRYCNGVGNNTYTPQNWYWRAGTSSNWSNHYFGQVYAYQFFDQNNTSYFCNPAGTSNMQNIDCNYIDIQKTSQYGSGMDLTFSGSNSTGILIRNNTGTTTSAVLFYYSSAPQGARGSITVSSTSTAYNTSSDYRLKENVVPMTGSLERVDQLNPTRFNFIGDDKTVDGFLAHEAAEVVPEAVTGVKDGVDAEGNPEYQGIDQAKLVPLLVGAIQELKAEVEALKQQLNGIN